MVLEPRLALAATATSIWGMAELSATAVQQTSAARQVALAKGATLAKQAAAAARPWSMAVSMRTLLWALLTRHAVTTRPSTTAELTMRAQGTLALKTLVPLQAATSQLRRG